MPTPARLTELALVFARHGNLTFGGGMASIAALRQDVVAKGWLRQLDSDLAYALSRLTPGTNALAFTAAAGWLIRGWPGTLIGLASGSFPAAVITLAATMLYETLTRNATAAMALRGAAAASIGAMFATGFVLIWPYFTKPAQRKWLLLFAILAGAFALNYFQLLSPFPILLLAAAVGALTPDGEDTAGDAA